MAKRRRIRTVPADWQSEAERLRFELVKIEALARAADDALTGLPFTRNAKRRAGVQRLAALVETTADAAGRALGKATR